MKEEHKKIWQKVKKDLDPERREHTRGVMYTCSALAMAHGADHQQAFLAGMLHDCAKCIPTEEKLDLCEKLKITLTKTELENPSLIHAKLGAVLAEKKYGVKDGAICHAISVHTTGSPFMNTLDKILYIADYIEPGREAAPNLAEIRKLAFSDLDYCMYRVLTDILEYLKESPRSIDPMTKKTLLAYQKMVNR